MSVPSLLYPLSRNPCALLRVSIAVRRHHDHGNSFFACLFVFLDSVSLCNNPTCPGVSSVPGWPWTHSDAPASASWVLGIKACTTTAQLPQQLLKGKHLIRAGSQFQRFSLLSSWWDMVVCKQTRCWRRGGGFYILIHRQQEVSCDTGHSLSIGDLRPIPTVTYFL